MKPCSGHSELFSDERGQRDVGGCMRVAIVKYNAGNIQSVATALTRLGASFQITDDERELRNAPRVIFPGVGEASSAMRYLRDKGLDAVISDLKQPVLGVCLGLQLLCRKSAENDATCLGLVDAEVNRFRLPKKVPHMGWSKVEHDGHPLFDGIEQKSYFYFVHSYRAEISADTVAQCTYGEPFSAAIAVGNFIGVQFHPEKSGACGQRLLDNFLRMKV
jgi:glutamine amidotransferase